MSIFPEMPVIYFQEFTGNTQLWICDTQAVTFMSLRESLSSLPQKRLVFES